MLKNSFNYKIAKADVSNCPVLDRKHARKFYTDDVTVSEIHETARCHFIFPYITTKKKLGKK